jgi:glycerophosphoryl diester phosphodiesterase
MDCKTSDNPATNDLFADSVASLIGEYGLAHRVMVESAHEGFLASIHTRNLACRTYLLTRHADTAIAVAVRRHLDGLAINIDHITVSQVARAHQAGLHVTLYNVATNNENFRALSMNPDNVQTDKLDHMVRVYVSKREED